MLIEEHLNDFTLFDFIVLRLSLEIMKLDLNSVLWIDQIEILFIFKFIKSIFIFFILIFIIKSFQGLFFDHLVFVFIIVLVIFFRLWPHGGARRREG